MSKNEKISKVIFYAPVGNLIEGFKNGGAEAGCRKTIEVLKKAEYDVLVVEKPARKSPAKIDGFLLIFKLIAVWLRLIKLFISDKKAVFHIAGFYLNQIYFEWFLVQTARVLGVRSIYEIRNGGMIEKYNEGHGIYKWFMKKTMLNSSLILCQGYDYVVFLKERFNRDAAYYPNYIMDDFLTDNNNGRENKQIINLIYFGRVVPDKNVEFIIDVCNELKQSDAKFRLDIIGAYEDTYHQYLTQKINTAGLTKDEIIFHGRKNFSEIYTYLKQAHFFIFPSKEKREGHSNSLTEAMGCGVVPIASTAGFNASIISNPNLVMNEFKPALYVDTINQIWESGQWKQFSEEVYTRVAINYTESVVKKSLLSAYNDL